MHCEARVGDFVGDIGELVLNYSSDFKPFHMGRPDVHKYALVRREQSGSYILMVSNTDFPNPMYDLIATVMGPVTAQAKELMADFEEGIPIELRPAPDFLQRKYDGLMRILIPQ